MKLRNMLMAGALALGALSAPAASFATATPIFAEGDTQPPAGPVTIKAPNKEGHTYKVYQIFTGTVTTNPTTQKEEISNIRWGQNGTGETGERVTDSVIKELQDMTDPKKSDQEKLEVLGKYLDLHRTNPVAELESGATSQPLPAGYYLIKDDTKNTEGVTTTVSTSVAVLANSSIEIEAKDKNVMFNKKVKDINDCDSTVDIDEWVDSADYDMGDKVPFRLNAQVPENIKSFAKFKMVFHDSYSTNAFALPEEEDIEVSVDDTVIHSDCWKYVPGETKDGLTWFTVTINDLLTVKDGSGQNIVVNKDSNVTVKYKAVLTTDADLGSTENNKNTAFLEFSNNPENPETTGKTPNDTVRVFTYKVTVNKTNNENEKLNGAEFTLYKMLPNDVNADKTVNGIPFKRVETIYLENGSTFEFKGLDDGTYCLAETKAPEGYTPMEDIIFMISAEHDLKSDDPMLKNVTINRNDFAIGTDKNASITIENHRQGSLPSTGGMGTTLLYGAGAVLVAGAGIALVTKKRMSKED